MSDPPTRQIYLPNFKVNVSFPAEYSDADVAEAIKRNKVEIQKASPVFVQGQKYLQNALGPENAGNGLLTPGLGINEQQARTQGISPAARAAQDATQYNHADQVALLRHYAAVRAINSANQHPNASQIIANARPHLLSSTQVTAIGDRATRAANDVINTPLLDQALDYGAPGASQQLEQMHGYGAGLARGVLGFSSPGSLGAMALLGPIGAEPMGAKMLLGAFGAPIVVNAYHRAQTGDIGGALGELTAASLPLAFHGAHWVQEAKNAADYRAGARWMDENYGVDADPPTPLFLSPSPDPNVYEAEFKPDRPTSNSSTTPVALPDRYGNTPQLTSFPPPDGFIDELATEPRTLGSTMPISYGQRTGNLPTGVGSDRDLSFGANRLEGNTQNAGLIPSRSVFPVPHYDMERLSGGYDLAADSGSLPNTSSAILTSGPPSTVLTISASETKGLSALLGEQHPFSMSTDQLFADGKTKANVLVTLPQLLALRNLAEQTTNMTGDELGSYSRPGFLKRLNATAQNFSNMSEPLFLDPHTSEFKEPSNPASILGSLRAFQPPNFIPTLHKRNQLYVNQGRNSANSNLAQINNIPDLQSVKLGTASLDVPRRIGDDVEGSYGDKVYALDSRRKNGLYEKNRAIGRNTNSYMPHVYSGNRGYSLDVTPKGDEDDDFDYSKVRVVVEGTLAEGKLSERWYRKYMQYVVGDRLHFRTRLERVLQGETLERARHYFEEFPQILNSPVSLHEYLPDRGLGTVLENDLSPSKFEIAINGRLHMDPELITFIIAEEAEHIAQELRGMLFDYSKPYEERVHEILAKEMAFKITGLPDGTHKPIIVRQHYSTLLKRHKP